MHRPDPIRLAAVSGFLTVALGAFGAHALSGRIPEALIAAYQTGVQYQGLHTLALLGVGILADRSEDRWLSRSAWLFAAGILLFSGSLYLMAATGWRPLGIVTPFGGMAFLAGWYCLGRFAWARSR